MNARPDMLVEAPEPRFIGTPPVQRAPQNQRWKVAIVVLLVLAGSELVLRGPLRFATEGFSWNDFVSPIVQSRAWLDGADPYNARTIVEKWPKDTVHFQFLKNDAAEGTLAAKRGIPSPYPLTTFVLLAPLSAMPWRVSHGVWLVLTVVFFLAAGQSLAKLAELKWNELRAYMFWTAILALAPFHTAIATGNLVVPALAAAMVGAWAAKKDRDAAAGMLLAIAVCLKPPLGLVFVAYYAIRRCWRVVLICVGLTAALAVVAMARVSGTLWLGSFVSNSRIMFGRGAINDFTTANPLHFHLVNLQMPLYSLSGSVAASDAVAWTVAGLLFVVWLALVVRHRRGDLLLELSALAVISLLPVYHRFVDAVLLVLPVCWAVAAREQWCKRFRNVLLILAAPFLAPGAAILAAVADRHLLPPKLTASWWWNGLLVPHQAWMIACLAVVMLLAMAAQPLAAGDRMSVAMPSSSSLE